ncbi:hypothetical protein OIU77_015424 [Salix suchowensis]|uniref:Secreted protein n=1 Tax=Salix suchowensis TaxID=1278906 RepID=A0ABQ8ZGX7_9ROSI|nr:hypothetical protein OIU77_015424 [Salix suchowensis]
MMHRSMMMIASQWKSFLSSTGACNKTIHCSLCENYTGIRTNVGSWSSQFCSLKSTGLPYEAEALMRVILVHYRCGSYD